MKRSILVGNGFLFHLEHLVSNYEYDSNLVNDIISTRNLFWRFKNLENDLNDILSRNDSIENILSLLNDLFFWYHKLDSFPISQECYNELRDNVKKIIDDNIVPIIQEFERSEKTHTYSKLWSLVKQFKIGESLTNHQDEIGVFTTNYDGYIDQILRKGDFDENDKLKGFVLKDGFAGGDNYHKTLYKPHINHSKIIHHLHSSYKFGWNNGVIIKTPSNQSNTDPLVILSDPNQKLTNIRMNSVLSTYWENFIYWINSSEELVIYGNSLQSDPHIVDVIIRYSTNIKTIYVIEKDLNGFDEVKSRLNEVEDKLIFIESINIGWSDFINIFNNPALLEQSLPF